MVAWQHHNMAVSNYKTVIRYVVKPHIVRLNSGQTLKQAVTATRFTFA